MEDYSLKLDKISSLIDDLIIDELGSYNTDDLNDIIGNMIMQHEFTSSDSIQSLIYDLEKLQDIYRKREGK